MHFLKSSTAAFTFKRALVALCHNFNPDCVMCAFYPYTYLLLAWHIFSTRFLPIYLVRLLSVSRGTVWEVEQGLDQLFTNLTQTVSHGLQPHSVWGQHFGLLLKCLLYNVRDDFGFRDSALELIWTMSCPKTSGFDNRQQSEMRGLFKYRTR